MSSLHVSYADGLYSASDGSRATRTREVSGLTLPELLALRDDYASGRRCLGRALLLAELRHAACQRRPVAAP